MFARSLTLLCLSLMCGLASAQTAVLVHGLAGTQEDWRKSGVAQQLESAGWHDAGRLSLRRQRVSWRGSFGGAAQRFVTVALDTSVGLPSQSDQLASYLRWLRERAPQTSFVLIGHSIGGVAARHYVVHQPTAPVAALITIASPHLGVPLAGELGELAGTAASALGPWLELVPLSGYLHSISQLAVEREGTFLFDLNRRIHPRLRYVAMVRSDADGGDMLVPAWSQDLRNVRGLKGDVQVITTGGTHQLSRQDGVHLIRVLAWLQQA